MLDSVKLRIPPSEYIAPSDCACWSVPIYIVNPSRPKELLKPVRSNRYLKVLISKSCIGISPLFPKSLCTGTGFSNNFNYLL